MSDLDFPYEVDAWFQCFGALFPLGRANFTRMVGHEEGGFYLADEFVGISADAVVLDFGNLYLAFRIDEESAAIRHTVFFNHHAKATAQYACRVGQHRIGNLSDAFAGIVPSLVDEV